METATHIAVVEDDPEVSQTIVQEMTNHGFAVTAARSGRDIDRVLSISKIDLVILDVGLPGEDGLSICRRLRNQSTVPIIMVTGLAEETDRIVGLEIGADYYLPKPFSPRELIARVRAVLRRSTAQNDNARQPPKTLMFEGWQLDMARRQLLDPSGVPMPLTSGEFNILAVFCQNPQKVLSRDTLLDLLHGRAPAVFDRSVDVQISRLRRKIEPNVKRPTFIKTVRYGGYFFTPAVAVMEAA